MVADLIEKRKIILLQSNGTVVYEAGTYQEVKGYLETCRQIDGELNINHAIFGKNNGEVFLFEREFEWDETDYIGLFQKTHSGEFE